MSSGNDNRWRRSSQQPPPRNQPREDLNPRGKGEGNMVRKPSVNLPAPGGGGVWGKGGTRGQGGNASVLVGNKQEAEMKKQEVELEKHVPVNDYNADEVRRMFDEDARKALGDAGNAHYKLPNEPKAAWGRKPGTMANGQSFFIELAKQLAEAESKINS